jgi:tetratricopeptide (TPR) repeat protein
MEYAVVLGAGRSVYGLGFYRSPDHHAQFCRGDYEQAATAGIWQVSFDPMMKIPYKDADLWEDHRLPVAGGQAYPVAVKLKAQGSVARPTASELSFLEGILWAIAATTDAQIDSGRWHQKVTTHDGPRSVGLAIPDLLDPPTSQQWMQRGLMPDVRAGERLFADMDRFFREHPPASVEEMNAVLAQQFTGRPIDQTLTPPATPSEKAQELCYQAFDGFGRRRVQLAREALEIDPDCADAYVILAEQSGTNEAELDYYAQGVAAGERSLGPETFEQHAGHFWGIAGTRPYMRARLGLGQALEQQGRRAESLHHYEELLRLNPNDNQGARYLLLPRLLESGRDVEAAQLLKSYKEESATWAYAQALLAFRLSGRSAAARRELRQAFRVNPHVPELLAHDAAWPQPLQYSPGSPEEALFCARELYDAFEATVGALPWLGTEFQRYRREAKSRARERRTRDRQKRKKRRRR